MKKTSSKNNGAGVLLSQAERFLLAKHGMQEHISRAEAKSLIHELQLNRRQLDVQIQKSRRTHKGVTESRDRYAHLYDSAPVGYFTLNRQGAMTEVNLTGALMLHTTRSQLVNQPFQSWVAPEFRETWLTHLQKLFDTGVCQTCEIKLMPREGPPFYVALESQLAPWETTSGRSCRTTVHDISTCKRVESELYVKERLLDGASDSIFLHDLEGNLIYVNDAASRDRGYEKEELLQKNVALLGTPKFAEKREDLLKNLLAEQEMIFEAIHRRKDGSSFPVEIHARLIELENRQLILCVARDISKRQWAEEALRLSAHKWRTTFDAIKEAVCLLDPEGRILQCNQAMLNLTGKTFDTILEHPCWEILHSASHPLDDCPFLRMKQTHQREESILAVEQGWVKETVDPILDEAGNLIGGVHLSTDITQAKKAEAALRESEERFRAIFDQAAVGVALIDSSTGRFLKINQKFCSILGLTPAQTAATTFMAITHPDDLQSCLEDMQKLQDGGVQSFSIEMRFCRVDRSPVWVNLTVSAMQELAEPSKYHIAVVEDITQRQQAEIEVRQGLEKLHQALRGTVQVLANTVEIKDPYTAGHQRRVAQLACAISQEMGLSHDRIEGMQVLSFLHDIGKIAVPAEILSRPGKISAVEFSLIKSHSEVGYNILKNIEFPWPVAQAVLQHHERLDGSGYPAGLSGSDIILEARILAVADVVEAMASHRPYRPSLGIEPALDEVSQNKGTQFDGEVVEACLRLFREKDFAFQ